jgi:putative tryptophan/tyrosine transport system substrate-binding protein
MTFLTNPANPSAETASKEMTEVSRLGGRLLILTAANPSAIERAFATLTEQHAGALVVGADTFYTAERAQIVALAARYRVPTSYSRRVHRNRRTDELRDQPR